MSKIKVLHTLPALDGGGAEKIVYDYCIRLLDLCSFDFVVNASDTGMLEDSLKTKGCSIYHIPGLKTNFMENLQSFWRILKNGRYDIVHISTGYKGLHYLTLAMLCGVKHRIAHAHLAYVPETNIEKVIRKTATALTKVVATDLFACGSDSAIWMWGKRAWNNGSVTLMRNAIASEEFAFDEYSRLRIREGLGHSEGIIIGNVARFSNQKNHRWLVQIFKQIVEFRDDAILVLVGHGELLDDIKKYVDELGIAKHVLFLGIRDDVNELLNAFDVFVLTSFYEGLPVVLIEAQANGLPVVVSDTVTRDISLSSTVRFKSLQDDECSWAEEILNIAGRRNNEWSSSWGYEIAVEAAKLGQIYCKMTDNIVANASEPLSSVGRL